MSYYPVKMTIVVRKDLKMSPGKVASQAAHVAVRLALRAAQGDPKLLARYMLAEVKYILGGKDLGHVLDIAAKAAKQGSITHVFVDSGPTTQGTGGEVTAIGLFDTAARVDKVTSKLDLF